MYTHHKHQAATRMTDETASHFGRGACSAASPANCNRKYAQAETASVQMLNPFVHKLELVTSADKIKVGPRLRAIGFAQEFGK